MTMTEPGWGCRRRTSRRCNIEAATSVVAVDAGGHDGSSWILSRAMTADIRCIDDGLEAGHVGQVCQVVQVGMHVMQFDGRHGCSAVDDLGSFEVVSKAIISMERYSGSFGSCGNIGSYSYRWREIIARMKRKSEDGTRKMLDPHPLGRTNYSSHQR